MRNGPHSGQNKARMRMPCYQGGRPSATTKLTWIMACVQMHVVYPIKHGNGCVVLSCVVVTLQWHHNGWDGISNHQPHDCLLNRLLRRRSKKTSKLCVTGLCAGNSPVTGQFPAQMASNAENVSIWWRHHVHYQFLVDSRGTYSCVVALALGQSYVCCNACEATLKDMDEINQYQTMTKTQQKLHM